MKFTHPQKQRWKRAAGLTLIELSLIIVVLLGLIGVMLIGVNAFRKGSDRTASILIIRQAQQGMRAHCGIENYRGTFAPDLAIHVFGENKYVSNGVDSATGEPKADGELPSHPVRGQFFGFTAGDSNVIPALGSLYICTGGASGLANKDYNPQPFRYEGW